MDGKLIITAYKNCIGDFLFSEGELQQCLLDSNESIVGNIYVAVVKDIVKNLQAAFVEYEVGKRAFLPLNNRLTESVKEGDTILVQIDRAAVKSKDPVATVALSISGCYCVVSDRSGSEAISYSKKLSVNRKTALQEYFTNHPFFQDNLKQNDFAAVIRTSMDQIEENQALGEELKRNIEVLSHIKNCGCYRTPYSLLYQGQREYIKQILKWKQEDFQEIVTDQKDVYEQLIALQLPCPLRFYKDADYSLTKLYSISTKVESFLHKTVYLKSGGNLVIEETEALIVIDVNTAKNCKRKDPDRLAFETNLEAAKEIARQLILRNLSGIILVDYINMKDPKYQESLIASIKKYCKEDPVPCNYIDFTSLGLAEITRKKIAPPLSFILKNS